MGIATSSKLVLGYEYDFLVDKQDEIVNYKDGEFDTFNYFLDEYLDCASPYFDADASDCVYGSNVVSSCSYSYIEVKDLMIEVEKALDDLATQLGKQFVYKYAPKVYLSAHVV